MIQVGDVRPCCEWEKQFNRINKHKNQASSLNAKKFPILEEFPTLENQADSPEVLEKSSSWLQSKDRKKQQPEEAAPSLLENAKKFKFDEIELEEANSFSVLI